MMTRDRKSATALAAREKARLKAQEMTARHELLLERAALYFELEDQSAARVEEATAQAQRILDDAARAGEAERTQRAGIVAKMLATGEPRALVAQRLGLTQASLRALLATTAKET